MDKSAQFEDCGEMPPFNLHLRARSNSVSAVKQEQDDESAVSTSEGWYPRDNDLSSSHENHEDLSECQTTSVLPMEILPTLADESMHFDDCGRVLTAPLHEGHRDSTVVVKKGKHLGPHWPNSPDEESAVSTSEDWHCGDADDLPFHEHLNVGQTTSVLLSLIATFICLSTEPTDIPSTPTAEVLSFNGCCKAQAALLHLGGHGDNTLMMKSYPDEPAFDEVDEDSSSGAFDCASSSRFHEGGDWKDGHLNVVEGKLLCPFLPDKIAPTLTGDSYDTKDRDGVSPSRLDLEARWDHNYVVTKIDAERGSSDSEDSSSSSSSQEPLDQRPQNKCKRPRYSCHFCPYSSASKSKIVMHERRHMGKLPFRCSICRMAFPNRYSLDAHAATHRDRETFKCSDCPEVFPKKTHLVAHHQKIHAPKHPFKCNICGRQYTRRGSLRFHKREHRGVTTFKCSTCPEVFRRRRELTAHEKAHKDETPFKCPACPKAFQLRCRLTKHERSHSNERPFKCPSCERAYHSRHDLTDHDKRAHRSERPFICPVCPKAFPTQRQVTAHKKIHVEVRPFKCPTCPKAFLSRRHLSVHRSVHTNEGPFKCPCCRQIFQHRRHLIVHEKKTHPAERPFVYPT
ncbi:unnamed protein product [Ixodes hexagonus]